MRSMEFIRESYLFYEIASECELDLPLRPVSRYNDILDVLTSYEALLILCAAGIEAVNKSRNSWKLPIV